ncbi:MAG: hypothetical protein K8R73_12425 [Clostridiales bacterium]|jgi:hypothetical protein|nr:hypothetical protein [Clostridiales bacterium]
MSIFEIIMLLCFGAAWPISIYKSLKSRSVSGKSVIFLYVIMIGYVAGIVNKLVYNMDWVILLYGINLIMVFTDTLLYYRNSRLVKQ